MSAGVSSGSHNGKGQGQDFELNLASIIDCFTVLITFLLATASFLSIGVLDAGIAAAGATAKTDAAPPTIQVTIELQTNFAIKVKAEGKGGSTFEVPATADKQADLAALAERLKGLKAQHPSLAALTLAAQDEVPYEDVIKAMNSARQVIPAVILGGF